MMTSVMLDTTAIPIIDIAALGWFILLTCSYSFYADHRHHGPHRNSIVTVMNQYRYQWMRQLLKREQRIVDAAVVGNLGRNISFLASTSILIVAGLVSVLGYRDKAAEVISTLPFAASSSDVLWEIKILLLVLIFVYAFFKFTWSLRTHSYTNILIGAAPLPHEHLAQHDEYARKASTVAINAARHFNQGMRAYYYGLAALSWFLHPLAFFLTITWVIAVNYRREFRSNTLTTLLGDTKESS